ncbi:hypothetical protein [Pedobacter gandavensis]|uniref:hypothetical protein n=1 Tax=Pedobacter gandavensis TaxID=2679963 RepID=UPI00293195B0|nr:hypothetical protein [Pedobacter gandavensis]
MVISDNGSSLPIYEVKDTEAATLVVGMIKQKFTRYMPDLYFKNYAGFYEVVGRVPVDVVYDVSSLDEG